MLILSAKLAMSFNGLEILKTQTMAAMVSSGRSGHCNLVHGIVGFASSFECINNGCMSVLDCRGSPPMPVAMKGNVRWNP